MGTAMFNANNTLPPPFVPEQRPFRMTSDVQRPLPSGDCRFILHPSAQDQRCSCQSFHHNRSIPGSTCDCGHQACYHRDAPSAPAEYVVQAATQAALENRVRQLEAELHYERQTREREARMLREALHPFYQTVEEMRRKVVDLEDRVDVNYDEQVRLKDRVLAVDDSSMAFERRLDELQGTKPKRRRISRQLPNGVSSDAAPASSRKPSDELSRESSSRIFPSRSISPTGPLSTAHRPQEPRSSGILNLVRLRGSPPYVPSRRVSPPQEEARSSGFLALDLAERLAIKANGAHAQAFIQPAHPGKSSPPTTIINTTAAAAATTNNRTKVEFKPAVDILPSKFAGTVDIQEISLDDPLKKRKRSDGLMPLDVLANVSAVSPMA